jgi:hypothetical protein
MQLCNGILVASYRLNGGTGTVSLSAGRNGKYHAEEHLAGLRRKVLQVDGNTGSNGQFTPKRNGLP